MVIHHRIVILGELEIIGTARAYLVTMVSRRVTSTIMPDSALPQCEHPQTLRITVEFFWVPMGKSFGDKSIC